MTRQSFRSWCLGVTALTLAATASSSRGEIRSAWAIDDPLLFAQLPADAPKETRQAQAHGMSRASYGAGGRIVRLDENGNLRVLTEGFFSACEFDVSFDGRKILFAGQRRPHDAWNIWEMNADGADVRQITNATGNCRSPAYLATFYTIVSTEPWYQIVFVSDAAGDVGDSGEAVATSLYSCKLDGSGVRRLTMNLSNDVGPFLMDDGRILLASWQRRDLRWGDAGRVALFGVNTDGTDYLLYCGDQGGRIKQMPCETAGGLVVFVESDQVDWDGAGRLASVSLRRPLHTHRLITNDANILYHSPSPLPDGAILVSSRPADGSAPHRLWRIDPTSGHGQLLHGDPRYHEVHAKVLAARSQPDGRSSVVDESRATGKLYCQNVYLADRRMMPHLSPGSAKTVRVLEGVPRRRHLGPERGGAAPGIAAQAGEPPIAQRRILGLAPVKPDGSFQVEVPADLPIELQLLDEQGLALESCGWIWAKHRAPQGCIGCHEDPELTPENRFVQALAEPAVDLTLPPSRRRTVDFRRDVMPILERKCAACHAGGSGMLDLRREPRGRHNAAYESLLADVGDARRSDGQAVGRFVQPCQARTSPLIWRLFGRNTSRPWDRTDDAAQRIPVCPPPDAAPLTDEERQTIIEWIDMGALWDGIPEHDD